MNKIDLRQEFLNQLFGRRESSDAKIRKCLQKDDHLPDIDMMPLCGSRNNSVSIEHDSVQNLDEYQEMDKIGAMIVSYKIINIY